MFQFLLIYISFLSHFSKVFDIAWAHRPDVFATAGADGSIRMFDLRHLEHSTIIYELGVPDSPSTKPLLRLSWNQVDRNCLATIAMDGSVVTLLDIRAPSRAVGRLQGHVKAVNAIDWAPHTSSHICSGGNDSRVLVWDTTKVSASSSTSGVSSALSSTSTKVCEPLLCCSVEEEVSNVAWAPMQHEWMAVAVGSTVKALHI